MREDVRKPKIRFCGFKDEWKNSTLGEVCDITSGVMGDSRLSNGNYRLTRIETISDGIIDEEKVGFTNVKPDDSFILQKGDILYSNINSIGQMGKVAEYIGGDKLYHGINLLRLSSKNGIYPDFLLYLLNTSSKRKWADAHANRAVSQASINQSLLESQEIFLCSILEQKKVGDFLTSLDYYISEQKRAYTQLVNMKSSLLEKMFPHDGAKVPEIRFDGFLDDWEYKKLGDICTVNGRIGFRGYTQKDIITKEEGGILTFSPTNIIDNQLRLDVKNTYITSKKFEESPEIKVLNGDILFVKTGSTLGKSALVSDLQEPASINPQIVILRAKEVKKNIVSAALKTQTVQAQIEKARIGGAVPTMTEERLKNISICLPIDIEEQSKIGDFLDHIDCLITFQQLKIDQLKNIKQSFMDKMFVS